LNHFTPSKTLPPITFDADPADYHKIGEKFSRGDPRFVMSNGRLSDFAKGQRKWMRGAEQEGTEAMGWGSLVDCITLTPARFGAKYVVCPETYHAEGKKKSDPGEDKPWNWNANYCKEWRAVHEADGKEVVKVDKISEAWKAQKRLMNDPTICKFLTGAKTQVQILVDYTDPQTGIVVPVKCLLDIVPTGEFSSWLGDLKTTSADTMGKWVRQLFEYNWHCQAALYCDAYNAATGEKRNIFSHVVSESAPPYEPRNAMLSDEYLQMGRAAYLTRLQYYCWCLSKNYWPGYSNSRLNGGETQVIDGWQVAEPMPWMLLSE
jgi:hypothetical protein